VYALCAAGATVVIVVRDVGANTVAIYLSLRAPALTVLAMRSLK
jgi:hypothetical protein